MHDRCSALIFLQKICGYGATVNNARIFRAIQQKWVSFDRYLWHWTEGQTIYETGKDSSELSDAVSKDLKRRGMKFMGTVIIKQD